MIYTDVKVDEMFAVNNIAQNIHCLQIPKYRVLKKNYRVKIPKIESS